MFNCAQTCLTIGQETHVGYNLNSATGHRALAGSMFLFCLFWRQGLIVYPWLSWTSPCRPGWPWIYGDPSASTREVLGLKTYFTTPSCSWYYNLSLLPISYFKKLFQLSKYSSGLGYQFLSCLIFCCSGKTMTKTFLGNKVYFRLRNYSPPIKESQVRTQKTFKTRTEAEITEQHSQPS